MTYLSVCSGIEAASVAWSPLGWTPWAFAEVDAFPSAVLQHHYPDVPNLGDMTQFQEWPDAAIDILVGGTPCQSFSVAGLRAGLADPRGGLIFSYLEIARRYRPRWVAWENVPGVLSTDGGRAFGSLLGGLAELGYGFAYRILDAQHFGLAQRRNRVFVVGYLGDWRRAAAVLFERASLSGDSAPRREAGEDVTHDVAQSFGASGRGYSRAGETRGQDPVVASTGPISHCRNAGGMRRIDYESETLITHSLRADGFDASEDGTGRGTPLIPVQPYTLAIRGRGDSHDLEYRQDGLANALLTPNGGRGGIGVGAVAFDARQSDFIQYGDKSGPLDTDGHTIGVLAFSGKDYGVAESLRSHPRPGSNSVGATVTQDMAVRRLTPRECSRLQGFPDDYLDIIYHGKPAADGPRYKALGNSMAVPVMAWIGRRIAAVERVA